MNPECPNCFEQHQHVSLTSCRCMCHNRSTKGELHQLFADQNDPQTAMTWLMEKMTKTPASTHGVIVIALTEDNKYEWRFFGSSNTGAILIATETIKLWVLRKSGVI